MPKAPDCGCFSRPTNPRISRHGALIKKKKKEIKKEKEDNFEKRKEISRHGAFPENSVTQAVAAVAAVVVVEKKKRRNKKNKKKRKKESSLNLLCIACRPAYPAEMG